MFRTSSTSLYIVPHSYSPHNTALFIDDFFFFTLFPSTDVQFFKLCSRISYSHQNFMFISSVCRALLVTNTVRFVFLFWLSTFHIRLRMAIKLKLLAFGLAWQLIVTTLHGSAVTPLRSMRFDTTTGFCVTKNCVVTNWGITYLSGWMGDDGIMFLPIVARATHVQGERERVQLPYLRL